MVITHTYHPISRRAQNNIPYSNSSNLNNPFFTPELWKSQEVKGPDGNYVDMRHVLVALDAINNPQKTPSFPAPGLPKVDSNIDNATWVGDLGGIIKRLVNQSNPPASSGEIQGFINDEAEIQDMLGDIDGLVIGYYYKEKIETPTNGIRISNILSDYYINRIGGFESRFSSFARIVGLGSLEKTGKFSGGKSLLNQGQWFSGQNSFSDEESWVNYYAQQVANSAGQFILGDAVKNPMSFNEYKVLADKATQQTEACKILLRRFLNTLKVYINKE